MLWRSSEKSPCPVCFPTLPSKGRDGFKHLYKCVVMGVCLCWGVGWYVGGND